MAMPDVFNSLNYLFLFAVSLQKWLGHYFNNGETHTNKHFRVRKTIFHIFDQSQGCNARKVNCSCVYSAYILKPVLSGRNL